MDVRRTLRVLTGFLAISLIASLPIQAKDTKTKSYGNHQFHTGFIGKSSSASARVTLVIPPRPKVSINSNADTSTTQNQKKPNNPTSNQ
ncbi:hypothetical protein ACH42_07760 [Endozoicomonas sp. (ex Bugula neritina AB1)]|nr:hypothetical protein ACH42_07760 [Endozoicomonas sp. (ex Bugula neritina AB1)]